MSESLSKTKSAAASSLIEVRLRKAQELEQLGVSAFATGFKPDLTVDEFEKKYAGKKEFDETEEAFRMAGRIIALRILGKASFIRLRDVTGDFQAYFGRDTVGSEAYKLIKKLDIGDIVGVFGRPFRTRTGELSLLAQELTLLTKSLRPLPEKWHGLSDVETRYRQRYLDLIVNPAARDIVRTRSRVIGFLREYLVNRRFLEVETPMMQTLPQNCAGIVSQTPAGRRL